jgi:hypothetical protein
VGKALGLPPGEVLDRAKHGDPQILYALAAETEQVEREHERWENLYKLIQSHGEAVTETIAKAFS